MIYYKKDSRVECLSQNLDGIYELRSRFHLREIDG